MRKCAGSVVTRKIEKRNGSGGTTIVRRFGLFVGELSRRIGKDLDWMGWRGFELDNKRLERNDVFE